MKRIITALAITMTLPGLALAANQGPVGPTSTGDFTVTLNVSDAQPQIELTGLQDATFDLAPNGEGDNIIESNLCVYIDQPDIKYDITVSGDPLQDDANTAYTYKVGVEQTDPITINGEFDVFDQQNSLTLEDLTPDTTRGCGGDNNLKITTEIETAVELTPTDGTANTTVTVTVMPAA